ncbi:hypothetical protein B0T18DRAFT_436877 [Schizothecium vesticola]|uniref:Uncharacterized protein n=1 Tax=Schizothecium vesticola TaxID=314040 RepID=A0AA40F134_9PEZI|nr:hypothetical protein B0T18DRAFT_436877 [Schizothecium vesticola]
MFCFPQHEHHSPARILHSFRSHRSLRASAAVAAHQSQPPSELYPNDPNMHLPHFHHGLRHQRKPSDAPTMSSTITASTTRSSSDSSRPSTSGGRSDTSSIEWNPLGLHPPLAPAPRLHQQRSLHSFQQHLQQTKTVPVPAAPRPTLSSHGHSRSAPPALVIYDGFDFGFGKGERGSAPSTPSTISGSSGPSTPAMRRPGPPGGMDGPDFFIKRGGWKRRGIVFTPEVGRGGTNTPKVRIAW